MRAWGGACGTQARPQDRTDARAPCDARSSIPSRGRLRTWGWPEESQHRGSVFSFQCPAHANWASTGLPAQDLRRGGSARKSKGKCGQQLPSQDTERTICSLIPENPNGEFLFSVYNEPYAPHSSQHHPAAPPPHLDLSSVRGLGRGGAALLPGKGQPLEELVQGSRFPYPCSQGWLSWPVL